MFSQKLEPIWSVASDGLTIYLETIVSLNIMKIFFFFKAQIGLVEKQVSKSKLKIKINEAQNK